ncbi:3-hydroxyacyl-ACP dehydratase FabZ family protein [Methylobacterium bullatum]|uniref:3-hydroxyacyl-ACP dehydratase FabZ family protein n=1 Tax=Methylobacterium bullatum TaxID=570505 RepID=UPI001782DD24|nr:hypothetical protein [Methylobacterium bullatum]
MMTPGRKITRSEIEELLPYRHPILMVDEVCSWCADEIVVKRHVDGADPNIDGHLIDGPKIMPGVLLIELVGQAAFLHGRLIGEGNSDPVVLGRCKARFIRPAMAGEYVFATVTKIGIAAGGAVHRGRVTIEGQLAAEIEIVSLRFRSRP